MNRKNTSITIFSKFLFTAIFILFFSNAALPQLEHIKVFSDYSVANSKRLSTVKADGLGGGIGVSFNLFDNFNLGVQVGYNLYSVSQDSALEQWKWDFWEYRYKGNVKNDTASDPNLSSRIDVAQKMDAIPVVITLNYKFSLLDELDVRPTVGGGFLYFSRRLYLEENWKKVYPAYNNYTFEYSYRNFAPNKTGYPFLITAGLNINYKLSELIALAGDFQYNSIIKTEGKNGYDDLPFNNSFSFKLGITFLY